MAGMSARPAAAIFDRMHESDLPVLRLLRERLADPRDDEAAYRRNLLSAIGDTLGWSVGTLWLPDASERLVLSAEWRSRWHPGTAFVEASRAMSFAPGEGLPGRVFASAVPSWIANVTEDESFCRIDAARVDALLTGIAIPLIGTHGTVLGVLEFFADRVRTSLPLLVELLDAIGRTTASAFEGGRRPGA